MNKTVILLGGVLFLSLAGNLFMAGYMIGDRAGAAQPAPRPPQEDGRAEWKKRDDMLRKQLSAADLKVFEEIKSANQPKIAELKQTLNAARDKVDAVEHAEPIDRAALEDAMKAEAAAKAEFINTIRAMRKDIAEKLSPEGRAAMEKLRPPKREGRRGDRRRGGDFKERRMQHDGDRPGFGFGAGHAPPPPEAGNGYGNGDPPAPLAADDCGGCEAPQHQPETTPPAQP